MFLLQIFYQSEKPWNSESLNLCCLTSYEEMSLGFDQLCLSLPSGLEVTQLNSELDFYFLQINLRYRSYI